MADDLKERGPQRKGASKKENFTDNKTIDYFYLNKLASALTELDTAQPNLEAFKRKS